MDMETPVRHHLLHPFFIFVLYFFVTSQRNNKWNDMVLLLLCLRCVYIYMSLFTMLDKSYFIFQFLFCIHLVESEI